MYSTIAFSLVQFAVIFARWAVCGVISSPQTARTGQFCGATGTEDCIWAALRIFEGLIFWCELSLKEWLRLSIPVEDIEDCLNGKSLLL